MSGESISRVDNGSRGLKRCMTALLLGVFEVCAMAQEQKPPIMLEQTGGFTIGGKIIKAPFNSTQTLSCDHGYVEYFLPSVPRKTSLFMWHSSSTQTFQNRWDGGEGFKDMFLRRGYPVYLWDGPRVGRANWACEAMRYTPQYRDQGNFVAWNLGPSFKNWWPDVQFPTENDEAWQQATSNRYEEIDTIDNVQLQSDAAAIAADSGKLGTDIVYLTNSASGLRALMMATKTNTTNVKALINYESYGYVYPDTANITAGIGGFGPIIVPLETFMKLTKIPVIQFVWSDHREESFLYLAQCRVMARLINEHGGNAQILMLGKDVGLKGSTHVAFADMDNDKVAEEVDKVLEANGLDSFKDDS